MAINVDVPHACQMLTIGEMRLREAREAFAEAANLDAESRRIQIVTVAAQQGAPTPAQLKEAAGNAIVHGDNLISQVGQMLGAMHRRHHGKDAVAGRIGEHVNGATNA